MSTGDIIIKGAREHNLRSVDLVIPRNKLVCFTGVSGSGKSSLAFDTLYAEGQRRYVESLSNFARQYVGQMPKPDFDFIGGLSPSISISQKSAGNNPRSTVGTITEIYDFLRVLYARVGTGHCPMCGSPITAQTREQIIEDVMRLESGTRFLVLAPVVRAQKGEFRDLFEDLRKQGFIRARVDGEVVSLSDDLNLDRQMRHSIEVVVDRLAMKRDVRARLAEAVDLALKIGRGNLHIVITDEGTSAANRKRHATTGRKPASDTRNEIVMSAHYACTSCGISFAPPSPQLFSFNSPQGMCLECDGLGRAYTFDPNLLIPDASRSFKQGCIELIGRWTDLGRWGRHIYQGVADSIERSEGLSRGTMLQTPWHELAPRLQDYWLWGTGDRHITFTWRGGSSPAKWGGTFDGIVPDLLSKYRNSRNRMQIAKLEKYMRAMKCPECHGQRLNAQARAVRISTAHEIFANSPSLTLPEVCRLPIIDALRFFENVVLDEIRAKIAEEVLKEIRGRLGFLINVGLDYLTLDRTAPTLSGGETQRIRLAGQVGCGLVGVLYILDEPSIGLHPHDNQRLLATLRQLRDMGNTVVVVEHDEETMQASDHIIDFGPGPGVRGGKVVAQGSVQQLIKARASSLTGQYLSGEQKIDIPPRRETNGKKSLQIVGAVHNNLQSIDVEIPLGAFVCITGVSGSGKSSLVNDIIVESLQRDLNRGNGNPGAHKQIEGLEHLDKLIAIDQSPIGRTPRSNPATYIKVFDEIRQLFTKLPESRRRGYKPGRFSFNVDGGRCQACDGNGSTRLEMDFLADVWVTCPVCDGHRFNRETLGVRFKEKSIADVLEMDVQQAITHFDSIPKIRNKLQTLHDVGLDYLKLGQPSPTLSGGEAQRIKLARELVKKSTGKTLYVLDEPTTGLHFADIRLLLDVLHLFVDAGNTVLVVEHNLDVIKTADWIIDLGPDGGDAGGRIVATGPPEAVATSRDSHTGNALKPLLLRPQTAAGMLPASRSNGVKKLRRAVPEARKIKVEGAKQHNLKDIRVDIDRHKMTVLCGPSGSGKSSLAMDTIYAEGQRRYVESLSAYARQFVGQMQKPQVDKIEGLSPAIAIEQQNLGNTPRSTVGTVTEIYDYLRILFARAGTQYCPQCNVPIGTQSADEIIEKLMQLKSGSKLYLMSPVSVEVGQEYDTLWDELRTKGFVRVRVDGQTYSLDRPPTIDRRRKHQVQIIVDRTVIRPNARSRIADSVEAALDIGRGVLQVARVRDGVPEESWRIDVHSQHLACEECGRSFEKLTPHSFSFNSYLGWCPECEGLGTQTGANPSALLRGGQLTLAEGAVSLWPNLEHRVSRLMLQALANDTGIPLDVSFDQLNARHRRMVMQGTGDTWFDVRMPRARKTDQPLFRFQFKGLYPALDEAARLSPTFRGKLQHLVDEVECTACVGSRIRDDAAAVRFQGLTIDDVCRQALSQLQATVGSWKLSKQHRQIAGELIREVRSRVRFLNDVGLDYLTLGRAAASLSGGEAQRIRLASQLGSGLCGVMYVLDEPTIGLHPRDNHRLLGALHNLRDLGNTLLVVEHDRDVIAQSDAVLDFGPRAGKGGGQVVAKGTPLQLTKRRGSVTGPYISNKKSIPVPSNRRLTDDFPHGEIVIHGARHHNLREIDVRIPLGTMTAVTGVSGSGKSTLVNDVLYASLARTLHRANTTPGAHDRIEGIENINKVIRVDQQPLGNSPSSNPATYTGAFELIRQLYAQLPDSKLRGYTARRFSFNVPGGRCEDCEGNGQKCIEMHFLPDVWIQCETCQGRRYNPETLAVQFHGQSIADLLNLTCLEALELTRDIPKIRRILQTLCDVGLDYLTLGQPAPTLSGGEAQRVKLAAELARPDTGRTLYLLDEPTTGLHFEDLRKLLDVLHRLVDLGNTVVVIEHNMDIIKSSDWIIDMGPEAGDRGGRVVTTGTPEAVTRFAKENKPKNGTNAKKANSRPKQRNDTLAQRSYTGEALAPLLDTSPYEKRPVYDGQSMTASDASDLDISDVGQGVRMPWETNGRRWHTQDRVGRNGEPCRWDGKVLDRVVDRIHQLGAFSETNWNAKSVVEIAGVKKSEGWFFHAITGETWLVTLKFRVAKNTFKQGALHDQLELKTLNQMDELPIYGNKPRVSCRNLRGPWQEVQIQVHSWSEIDTDFFWRFLAQAVESFLGFSRQSDPKDWMPWKKLGEKWHFSRKGFPPRQSVQWDVEVLDTLCATLRDVAPGGQFRWDNQQVVHLFVSGRKEPWASLYTKRPTDVDLVLNGPKGRVALGRIADLGRERSVDTAHHNRDVVRLKFRKKVDVKKRALTAFLQEHLAELLP